MQKASVFETLNLQTSWQRITLNRGMFPTNGSSTVLSLSSTIPGGDIDYARMNIRQKLYRPINQNLVFGFNIDLGYLRHLVTQKKLHFSKIFMLEGLDLFEDLNQIH